MSPQIKLRQPVVREVTAMFSMNALFFSKWSRVTMLKLSRNCRSQRRRSQWLPPGANHASGQPCTVFGQTLGLESDGTEERRMQ